MSTRNAIIYDADKFFVYNSAKQVFFTDINKVNWPINPGKNRSYVPYFAIRYRSGQIIEFDCMEFEYDQNGYVTFCRYVNGDNTDTCIVYLKEQRNEASSC